MAARSTVRLDHSWEKCRIVARSFFPLITVRERRETSGGQLAEQLGEGGRVAIDVVLGGRDRYGRPGARDGLPHAAVGLIDADQVDERAILGRARFRGVAG